jgi:carboxymethylenebutenolidase
MTGRFATLVLAAGLCAVQARAAEQSVQFKSGDELLTAVLVTPEGKGPFPGVVVIHEWWGLNDWVKGRARALAQEGYAALAVDLYRGKVATKQEDAHQYMMSVSQDRALRDLKAAYTFLAQHKDVLPTRIGAIGWCMGGRYTALLAVEEPGLAAGVVYYGALPTEPAAIARIQAPLLGNFGGDDKGPSPDQVKTFEASAQKAGKSVDLKVYPGAGHAFANVNNPWGGYRESAAQDAWARTTSFFARHLKVKTK